MWHNGTREKRKKKKKGKVVIHPKEKKKVIIIIVKKSSYQIKQKHKVPENIHARSVNIYET